MSNKKQLILKQNAIISAGVVEKPSDIAIAVASERIAQSFNAKEHDMVNALLYILQDIASFNDKNFGLFNFEIYTTVSICQEKLCKFCKISPSAAKEIVATIDGKNISFLEQTLLNVRNSAYILKNVTIPKFNESDNAIYENGQIVTEKVKSVGLGIISRYTIKQDDIDARKNLITITFDKLFLAMATKQFSLSFGNFSKLDKSISDNIKNKNAKRLYEYLQSKKTYRDIDTTLDVLRLLFGTVPTTEGYKIIRIIENAQKALCEVMPFSFDYHKTDKKITFHI